MVVFGTAPAGIEVSGLEDPGCGSGNGRGKIPEVSILIGSGFVPLGGDSVEVVRGAKSPDGVGGGLLDLWGLISEFVCFSPSVGRVTHSGKRENESSGS